MHNQAAGFSQSPKFCTQAGQNWAPNPEDITSMISNELRTPLTSIQASLDRLRAEVFDVLPEKSQQLLEIALNNTDQLLRLAAALEQAPGTIESFGTTGTPDHCPKSELMQRLAPLNFWRQQAVHDQLTACTRFQQESSRAFAVLVLGLDRFQVINDSLGYAVGNQLLIALAQRLLTSLPPNATIARLTSDKFAILLENVPAVSAVASLADYIQQVVSLPFVLEQRELFITVSIGIAWAAAGGDQLEDWLYNADTAMHRAKALGRGRYTIFEAELRRAANSQLQLETDLRLAIERGEFQLYYQPIIPLQKGKPLGFEALIRWQHPEQGLIPPAKFIPLAEETGLITTIGQWVLREACQQLHIWQQQFPLDPPLTLSVNLSAPQLAQPHLLEQIQHILQETGAAANSLKLEITESAMMEQPEQAVSTLKALKTLGIQIALDDFGTGYSSLSYLYQFPLDTLKIDRSFINRMDKDFEQLEIVRTIVQLAWNLGIEVVAEGIETKQQMEQLRMLGCDLGQGYLFSKPVDNLAATQLLRLKQFM